MKPHAAPDKAIAREGAIQIYTDGSAWPNDGTGQGGWAAVVYDGPETREYFGGECGVTNNQMELRAAIEGLTRLPEASVVTLYSDSEYVVKGMSQWISAWKRRGWKTADKKPVKNENLWRRLDQEARRHRVTWTWVRSHSGVAGNERADELARRGMHERSEAAADMEMMRRAGSY